MGFGELAKEAVRLKKEKRFDEACRTLQIAYQSADVGEFITIQDRLKLPMYLMLSGRANDGWNELNRLGIEHPDRPHQIAIRSAMKEFAEKEGRFNDALFYEVWVYVMQLMELLEFIVVVNDAADKEAQSPPLVIEKSNGDKVIFDLNKNNVPVAITPNGNPIYDVAYNHMLTRLNRMMDIDEIDTALCASCKRIGREDITERLADEVIEIVLTMDGSNNWVGMLKGFISKLIISEYSEDDEDE
ncbi:hypothetical protein [Yersinia pseudotuberculosis]|uniref:hypothetical protein n=1 Tax=Yersinia pseudotuberculosis TaxID=633 RepID=UPI001A9D6C5A|nr:hypothetical protein [Yersinia pseudotuberculosis]MBO1550344.1 hypothetical protein [Yersinia pseudotuberculosis]MBO1563059.1 hypothetical protein [Yersinia pseudotuberculosis]MBO1571026.1 hypothetical protein [Yersinia pseudotuberculosis]MBO1585468.1 hypothetical protein [Yersinia pseudotuberculosis]MBO1635375.1 hypothetical protein [Yersinia pseudotuberculosis]